MRRMLTLGVLATALVTGLSACEVNKTSEGEMPTVDVDAGKLPGVEIKGPDVEVGSKEVDLTVPTVDVDTPAQSDAEAAGAPDS